MTSTVVQTGESFDDISRREFGSVDKASSIIAANPGASNPPTPGTTLIIPKVSVPNPPRIKATTGAGSKTSLVVDGSVFLGWDEIEFTRSMDSFGAFNFRSVWQPDNREFREIFRPFEYRNVAVFEDSELLFNGTMIEVMPSANPNERTVMAAGYSLPGVLNDCSPPISALPLERDVQDLQQIASSLLEPFGIDLVFDGEPGPIFDREAIEPTDKIYNYLIELAKQRQLIITDTPDGACKFHTEVDTGSPVAVIKDGDPGILVSQPQFGVQNYYSHVSGQGSTFYSTPDSEAGSTYTVVNPRLSGILRPFTFKPNDTLIGDTKKAVEAKSGRMFAGAVAYTVTIPSWRDASGNLWKPNTTIKLQSSNSMIYNSYEFLIREVAYRKSATEELATLTLIIPGSFKGLIPDAMPWDE